MKTAHAASYANSLLESLGETQRLTTLCDHPALSWRRSGLMQTTQAMLPLPLASAADGALMALKAISGSTALPESGSVLLGERARLRKTIRQGRKCAGGYGQLIDTRDGRIALNLVRDDDWDLVPAWLEAPAEDWDAIKATAADKDPNYLVDRASEIGLAVAKDEIFERPTTWFQCQRFAAGNPANSPLIVDLSGLWAGPLASSLLGMCGARVIKIEGPNRPDGMRAGHKGFYTLLNGGKDCAAFEFRDPNDLKALKRLLSKADIVIEASRSRALKQLGIFARDFVSVKPGMIWARLTAYGRDENRIGFGDDIGVSAGLSSVMERAYDEAFFVGDAIADPVNGLHLALAILSFYQKGGGAILDITMRDVLRFAMGDFPENLKVVTREWESISSSDISPLYSMRRSKGEVKALGADTADIVKTLC